MQIFSHWGTYPNMLAQLCNLQQFVLYGYNEGLFSIWGSRGAKGACAPPPPGKSVMILYVFVWACVLPPPPTPTEINPSFASDLKFYSYLCLNKASYK